MARIVWIASYPKSGNTWVRFLVANLVYGPITDSAKLTARVPDIHVAINAAHLHDQPTTFVKTHWAHHAQLPLREDTVGAIYVARHPLDVMASNLHYALLRQGTGYFARSEAEQSRIRKAYIDDFIAAEGAADWVARGYGTWPQNVRSWLKKDLPFPRLRLRYEDLKADPVECTARLSRFCGIERSTEEIEAAVEAASFESLRAMEEREIAADKPGFFTHGPFERAHREGLRFMNRGDVGCYREILTPEQIAAGRDKLSDLMAYFRYEA